MNTPESVVIDGDCIARMAELPERHFHVCVTSPPYWGLRDYGHDGQIGLEETPESYIAKMVEVGRGVWRVLRDDGTLWVNIGDCYAANRGGTSMPAETIAGGVSGRGDKVAKRGRESDGRTPHRDPASHGLKHKDLMGMPWRVALALQADGWYLRSDCIWHKPNPMPESVTDRCTKAHEYIFMFTKAARYFYDAHAIRQPLAESSVSRLAQDIDGQAGSARANGGGKTNGAMKAVRFGGQKYGDDNSAEHRTKSGNEWEPTEGGSNCRTVWTIPTQSFSEAHFATYPEALPERCIKAGTSERGCCPECGAPWVRVMSKERKATRPGSGSKVHGRNSRVNVSRDPAHVDEKKNIVNRVHHATEVGNRDPERHVTETRTVGWEQSCDCTAAPPIPCRVLDPFNGAGTTGLVAGKLGRAYVGIELNPEYAEMARQRIARGLNPSTYRDMHVEVDAPLFSPGALP